MNIKKPSPDTMKEQAVRQAKDLLITVLILTAATGIGNIFWYFSFTKNIISVYILGTLLTSLFTKSYFYGFLSSFSSVLLFNFCFTEPRLTLRHRDVALLRRGITELAARLRGRFGRRVLGPMTPPVDRIRGEYLAGLLLKVESGASSARARELLGAELKAFSEDPEFRNITVVVNVDPQ